MNINKINTYQNIYNTFEGKKKKKKKKVKKEEPQLSMPISNKLADLSDFDKQQKGKMSLTEAIRYEEAKKFADNYSGYNLNIEA